jgi:predicted HicB family RNase H-like nuclease
MGDAFHAPPLLAFASLAQSTTPVKPSLNDCRSIIHIQPPFCESCKRLCHCNDTEYGKIDMSSISLRLPESLHKQARELAKREDISINQLIATALAEKMSALMTGEYLVKLEELSVQQLAPTLGLRGSAEAD